MSTFSQTVNYVGTKRPSGICGRGLSSIRALQLAWRALKVFIWREWMRRFPGILCLGTTRYFASTCRQNLVCRFPLSQAHSTGHTPQLDNRTCGEHDVTSLRPISISKQHHACVTRPSARYSCCGYNSCVHRRLRSVIHLIYLSLLWMCDRSTPTVDGNVIVWAKYQYLNCIDISDVLFFFPETQPINLDIRHCLLYTSPSPRD